MKIRVKALTCLKYLRMSGKFLAIWPLNTRNKFLILLNGVAWWVYLVNYLSLWFPTINAFYITSSGDFVTASYTWMELLFLSECMIVLINSKFQSVRLQALMLDVENLLNQGSKISLKSDYAYPILFGLQIFLYLVIEYMYINKPESVHPGLIMTSHYPFEVNSRRMKIILNVSQLFALNHGIITLITDGIVVLLLYSCTIRLKMLDEDLKKVRSYRQLVKNIREHQATLLFIEETNHFVGIIVIKIVLWFMIYSITAGLILFHENSRREEWLQQFPILAMVYMRIYICVEVAENMMEASDDIEKTIYASKWYDQSSAEIILKVIIMRRCQKLPRIHVKGLMNTLNRNYLRKITCATFSYFTTIRQMINK